jgi:hypothetical protein
MVKRDYYKFGEMARGRLPSRIMESCLLFAGDEALQIIFAESALIQYSHDGPLGEFVMEGNYRVEVILL